LRNRADSEQLGCALTGGDDYELCFTAPAGACRRLEAMAATLNLPLTRIGAMKDGLPGVTVTDASGRKLSVPLGGYDHFGNR
jgi:thiamine-monophosphate kinase